MTQENKENMGCGCNELNQKMIKKIQDTIVMTEIKEKYRKPKTWLQWPKSKDNKGNLGHSCDN